MILLLTACNRLGLIVNLDKTKVIVHRKGGHLSKHEKWFLGPDKLEVVNEYKYLGFPFTTTMSLKQGTDFLATKGKKGAIDCIRTLRQLDCMSIDTFFKIFDAQVQPIILYASEVWGIIQNKNIEPLFC